MKCVGEVKKRLAKNFRIRKIFNGKRKQRSQIMGEGKIYEFVIVLVCSLKNEKAKKLAAKLFRRSTDAQLVDASVHVAGLCEP